MLKIVNGDLLEFVKATHIAHQCNCKPGVMGGLAGAVRAKYPMADTGNFTTLAPGTISVCDGGNGVNVVNLYGQVSPGRPKMTGIDTAEKRLGYFKRGLFAITQLPDIHSLALPYMVGCGMAGGIWEIYEAALIDFADYADSKNIEVYLVRKGN